MKDIPTLKGSLANWIANAQPGETVLVQTAVHNANPEVSDAIRAGHITTFQKRAAGHAFHLIARRINGKAEKPILGRGSIGAHIEKAPEKKGPKRDTLAKIKEAVTLTEKGWKREEVAKRLGVSPETVKKYMRQARNEGLA